MERPFRREVRNDADQRAPRTPASSAWSMMTLSGLRSAGTAHLASVTVFTLAVAGTTGLLVADPMAGPATAVAGPAIGSATSRPVVPATARVKTVTEARCAVPADLSPERVIMLQALDAGVRGAR